MAGGSRRSADERLIASLAGGATVKAAAEVTDISEATIYRRLADPAFKRRVQQARADFVEQAVGALAEGATEAVTALRGLLGSDDERVVLGAARAVLELGTKLRESVELSARVAALERRHADEEAEDER